MLEQFLAPMGRWLGSGLLGYALTFLAVLAVVVGVLAFARRADDTARRAQRSVAPAMPPAATAEAALHSARPEPQPPRVPATPREPDTAQPLAVLVVDDSAVARAKLRKLLEGAGFVVDVANDGEQALDLLSRKFYAVLITDLEMPVLDGFQVIAHVQGSLETEDLPIIAITGHEELSARVNDCQGLYGIFKKPWNDRELLKRVATVAQLRGATTGG
ncbi:MAG: response regulator [Dechloromonas sp.]|nr:response regulator [Dechloromonas sp.]